MSSVLGSSTKAASTNCSTSPQLFFSHEVEEYSMWGEESHHAIPSGKCLIGNGFIFQYHNDPKHTANAVKSYLESPDLNIIEAAWDHLDRESKELLKEASYNIPEDY